MIYSKKRLPSYSFKTKGITIKTTRFITMVLLASVIASMAVGCREEDKKELAFRNSYKKIWDKTALDVDAANKKIQAAYGAGDVDAVVAEYKALAVKYEKARKEMMALETPVTYVKLIKKTQEYLTYGAQYFNQIARVVDETGGNYGDAQSAEFKTTEKKWALSTEKVEREMKTMRFTLQ